MYIILNLICKALYNKIQISLFLSYFLLLQELLIASNKGCTFTPKSMVSLTYPKCLPLQLHLSSKV